MKGKPYSNMMTVEFLQKRGFLAETVEKIIPRCNKRRDLYNMYDVVAVKPGEGVLFIQATTKNGLGEHRTALLGKPGLEFCLRSASRVQLWSWRETVGSNGLKEPRVEEAFLLADGSVEFRPILPPGTCSVELLAA
jgi:hypothetical protein